MVRVEVPANRRPFPSVDASCAMSPEFVTVSFPELGITQLHYYKLCYYVESPEVKFWSYDYSIEEGELVSYG